MGLLKSKVGWGLSAAYILISAILIMSLGVFGESFITLILGLPWILILPLAQFEFFGISSLYLLYLAAFVPILLNAILLYIIGALLEKGRARLAAILVAAIILGGYSYYHFARFFVNQSEYILPEQSYPAPITCVDVPEGEPVITSISTSSGPVGTQLEIRGCNFSGFEGDKNAWIENYQGVKGVLYGQEGSTSKLLRVVLQSPLCQTDTSYSGLDCNAYLSLTPGIYKIYTEPWGKRSNEVAFTITDNEIVKPPPPGPFAADAVRNLTPQTLKVGQNQITAEVRGYMFFEGETQLALYDGITEVNIGTRPDGLPNTVVSADGEWMTTGYVPVAQTLTIPAELQGQTLTIRFIANDPRDGAKPRYWGTLLRVK